MGAEDKRDWSHLEKLFRDYIEGRPMQQPGHWPQAWGQRRSQENKAWVRNEPAGE